jgi:hypothetical protein
MLAVTQNVGNRVNEMGNFKELKIGAGSTILFKANREGCFSGAANYSEAPLKWNNAGYFYATTGEIKGDFIVSGSLFSDDGSTFQTKLLEGRILFLKNGTQKAFIKTANDSASLQCATGSYFYVTNLAGTPLFSISSAAVIGIGASTFHVTAPVQTDDYFQVDSYVGATGTFDDNGGHTITVKGGIITDGL